MARLVTVIIEVEANTGDGEDQLVIKAQGIPTVFPPKQSGQVAEIASEAIREFFADEAKSKEFFEGI